VIIDMTIANKKHKLLFRSERSRRYHEARERFYNRFQFVTSFISLLASSATIVTVLASAADAAVTTSAIVVAVSSALNLVARPSHKVVRHHNLRSQWADLRAEIEGKETPTTVEIKTWNEKVLRIENDEPPVLHVLNALMYNRTITSMGLDIEKLVKVRWYQRVFASLCDVLPDRIPLPGE
jgi:hypothetical protein